MSRWEPNARERLMESALELYRERGFDATTVAEIAARAGLTERTFFRYFADKREVLFSGSSELRAFIVETLGQVPASSSAIDAVGQTLEAAAVVMQERAGVERARQRHAVIAAHADLLERELIKLAGLASAIAEALRGRGTKEPAASLVAEAGIGVFKVAFQRWLEDAKNRDFALHIRDAMKHLKAATAA